MSRRQSARAIAQAREEKAQALAGAWPGLRRAKRIVAALAILFALQIAVGTWGACDQFDTADGVASGSAVVAFAQAAAFAWAFDAWRRGCGGTVGAGRGTFTSTGQVLTLAVIFGLVTWMIDATMVCAAIDRALGRSRSAPGRIVALAPSSGKGCHLHAQARAAAPEVDFTFCADDASWKGLVIGDPVRLRIVDGPLGRMMTADRIDREERHRGG